MIRGAFSGLARHMFSYSTGAVCKNPRLLNKHCVAVGLKSQLERAFMRFPVSANIQLEDL